MFTGSVSRSSFHTTAMRHVSDALVFAAIVIVTAVEASGCGPSASAIRLSEWSDTLSSGPVRMILTLDPASTNDVERVDFYAPNERVRVFVRLVDAGGRMYRLPGQLNARWTIVGGDDKSRISIQGYHEEVDVIRPSRNMRTSDGYTEGQYLSMTSGNSRSDIPQNLLVTVQLLPDVVLERSIGVGLRLPPSRD